MANLRYELRKFLDQPSAYQDFMRNRPDKRLLSRPMKLSAGPVPMSIRSIQNTDASRRRKTKITLPAITIQENPSEH